MNIKSLIIGTISGTLMTLLSIGAFSAQLESMTPKTMTQKNSESIEKHGLTTNNICETCQKKQSELVPVSS